MSNEHRRDHGKLFEYAEKPKPSHPDFHGDCVIDGAAYTIKGWHREEQLTVSIEPEQVVKNGLPPQIFRGSLEPAPPKPAPVTPVRPGYYRPYVPRPILPPPEGAQFEAWNESDPTPRADKDAAMRCMDPIVAKLAFPKIKETNAWVQFQFSLVVP